MLNVVSVNVNGIRAAVKERSEENKGFFQWLNLEDPRADVILMQEVRAGEKDTLKALAPALDAGWHYVGAESSAKGRAGVGILSRFELTDVTIGLPDFEEAGRYIEATVKTESGKDLRLGSLYLPSGDAETDKQDEKYHFLDIFEEYLEANANAHEYMVIGGDWNICHREQDIKNHKTNRNSSGFLADERAFMDKVFGYAPDAATQLQTADEIAEKFAMGTFFGAVDYKPSQRAQDRVAAVKAGECAEHLWHDVVRELDPEGSPYTWWSYRGQAFNNDAGWRIDYQAANENLAKEAVEYSVDKAVSRDMRWSDHAPLLVRYNI
ncbi:MAG: exodeoxyribonuclease III [Corynebacterium sp.]|nr:exodeoxyribonuclease III [Corynebacterium sp.]